MSFGFLSSPLFTLWEYNKLDSTPHPQEQDTIGHGHGSQKSYFIGFLLSIILTLAAYYIIESKHFGNGLATLLVVGLGLAQAWIQLYFFLHVFDEAHPRWNLLSLLFMAMVVFIIVGGSLWIMKDLEYRTMSMDTMKHSEATP